MFTMFTKFTLVHPSVPHPITSVSPSEPGTISGKAVGGFRGINLIPRSLVAMAAILPLHPVIPPPQQQLEGIGGEVAAP